ncbi:hypothetical protein FRB90_006508 [Tulasnella sp. 427]|nr:hypothetical protein FRB90_006508 [Tulasnella sp. 427]
MVNTASDLRSSHEKSVSAGEDPSTSSSIQDPPVGSLRQLHGQAVNSLTDAYMLTGDAKEHARLDTQHAAIALLHGGFVPRESSEDVNGALIVSEKWGKPRILDLGTGSGAWAIAMARQYPDMEVLGIDLVPVIPGSMLRPGGLLLIVDGSWVALDETKAPIQAENPGDPGFTWLHKFMTLLRTATTTRNPNFTSIEHLDEMLKKMGENTWESITSIPSFMPIGDWSEDVTQRRAGELIRESLFQALTSTRPLLLSLAINSDELDRLSEELRSELSQNTHHQYLKGINVWAQKSVAPGSTVNRDLSPPGAPTTSATTLRQVHGYAVNSLTDAYLLTGDAEEHARLDAQHAAITLVFGGLLPSEAREAVQTALVENDGQPKPAILDIGTGSGAWAIDMAKLTPQAEVLGLDLVTVIPGS